MKTYKAVKLAIENRIDYKDETDLELRAMEILIEENDLGFLLRKAQTKILRIEDMEFTLIKIKKTN